MTLEGEYYGEFHTAAHSALSVAILMTLEGEYYSVMFFTCAGLYKSQSSWHWKANITIANRRFPQAREQRRNPHDIGRRILHRIVIFTQAP